MKKKLLLLIIFMVCFIPNVYASNITKDTKMIIKKKHEDKLTDKNEETYVSLSKKDTIKITSKKNIYGIYIIYESKTSVGLISDYTHMIEIGNRGFAHEYINIEKEIGLTKKLVLTYDNDVDIAEIYVIGEGELPSFVEVWEEPCEKADLLVLPTHSDDEHLFFAGLIPHYLDKKAKVQVAYFADHSNNPKRLHEQLHGLYAVGMRNYPIFGIVPDKKSYSLKAALRNLNNNNITEDDVIKYQVQLIRKLKPLVVVGHDEYGEYSHGQHIFNTSVLKKAIKKANQKSYDKDSYKKYGLWNIPKVYLHLYNENEVIMDFDKKLKSYNGATAYEMSKIGFSKHISQQNTWYTKWLNGEENEFTKATNIETFSPLKYGLYYSIVGNDKKKNDMFENLYMRNDKRFDEKNLIIKENNIKDIIRIIILSLMSILILIIMTILYCHIIIKIKKNK